MTTPQRGRRRMAALEARRFEAARLFTQGASQAAVMRRLRVSRQTAHRWYPLWRRRGREGLKAAGRLGRKRRLDARQLARVERALLRGPQRHGFPTDLWTLPRAATVIERLTCVHYHAGHVWYILRGLQWSLQRPARQGRERRTGHPAMDGRAGGKKNARRRRAWLVFEDESGVSQQPVVRRR